ncbi:MAG: IS110 family transposase [Cocleimonas sp.]|nr:IS110 family transposase [Cocleimonas sp.]
MITLSTSFNDYKRDIYVSQRYKRLISIKGVADRTAIKFLGELGILASNMSAKQWIYHAGLFPRELQSGTSVNKRTSTGKAGNRYIHEALYMSTISASGHNPNILSFYQYLINDNEKDTGYLCRHDKISCRSA